MKPFSAAALLVLVSLTGCGTSPDAPPEAGPPKAELQFIDLPGFDKALNGSLDAALPRVGVDFYDQVAPSALPERLQSWLAAVETGGGKVKVVPPPPTVRTRSPLLLLSALTSLWTASKVARELAARQQFKAAQSYDAEILLKQDDRGQTLVDKVVFVQRPRK